jgi:hypothetical protein
MTDITARNLTLLNARSEAMDAFVRSQKVACRQFLDACFCYDNQVWKAEQDFKQAAAFAAMEEDQASDMWRDESPVWPTSGSGSDDKEGNEGEEGSERPKKFIKTK